MSILKLKSGNVLLDFLIPLARIENARHNNIKTYNAVCLQEFNVQFAVLLN